MLANFLGVLPILTPPLCALAFIMCSKSNPIVVFALDLMSTYEREHTIFGLLEPISSYPSGVNSNQITGFSGRPPDCSNKLWSFSAPYNKSSLIINPFCRSIYILLIMIL
jgi:hypothetical protein